MPRRPEGPRVFQLKVTIAGIDPAIWRSIQVLDETTLPELHDILQVVMDWEWEHLHSFTVGKVEYSAEDPGGWDLGVQDEEGVQLSQVLQRVRSKMSYTYDFGDNWQVDIVVEKSFPPETGVEYPVVVAGERAGPPEDCSGIWGYYDILDALQDHDNPEHEDRLDWLGEDYDPEAFDREAANRRLHAS